MSARSRIVYLASTLRSAVLGEGGTTPLKFAPIRLASSRSIVPAVIRVASGQGQFVYLDGLTISGHINYLADRDTLRRRCLTV